MTPLDLTGERQGGRGRAAAEQLWFDDEFCAGETGVSGGWDWAGFGVGCFWVAFNGRAGIPVLREIESESRRDSATYEICLDEVVTVSGTSLNAGDLEFLLVLAPSP